MRACAATASGSGCAAPGPVTPAPLACHPQVPAVLRPWYHWFNIPASSDPKSGDNPLNHIRAVARPEDYVLLKLDIDCTPVEEAIIAQLLSDPTLLVSGWESYHLYGECAWEVPGRSVDGESCSTWTSAPTPLHARFTCSGSRAPLHSHARRRATTVASLGEDHRVSAPLHPKRVDKARAW
jgi:hypothetical protein